MMSSSLWQPHDTALLRFPIRRPSRDSSNAKSALRIPPSRQLRRNCYGRESRDLRLLRCQCPALLFSFIAPDTPFSFNLPPMGLKINFQFQHLDWPMGSNSLSIPRAAPDRALPLVGLISVVPHLNTTINITM